MQSDEFSRIAVFYADEIEKCPELGGALEDYIEILEVQRNIRKSCSDDSPEFIKEHIGSTINGLIIDDETYKHALTINTAYQESYAKCKNLLKQLSMVKP